VNEQEVLDWVDKNWDRIGKEAITELQQTWKGQQPGETSAQRETRFKLYLKAIIHRRLALELAAAEERS
jgi:hypothetical protein